MTLVLEDVQKAMAMDEVQQAIDDVLLCAISDADSVMFAASMDHLRGQLGVMLGLECSGCAEGHEEYGEFLAAKLGDELHADYVMDPLVNPLAYVDGGTRKGVVANLTAWLAEEPSLPSFDAWVRAEQERAVEALGEQRWEASR